MVGSGRQPGGRGGDTYVGWSGARKGGLCVRGMRNGWRGRVFPHAAVSTHAPAHARRPAGGRVGRLRGHVAPVARTKHTEQAKPGTSARAVLAPAASPGSADIE